MATANSPMSAISASASARLMPWRSLGLTPDIVRIRLGPALVTEELSEADAFELTGRARLVVATLYKQLDSEA